jgi:hypothetical protein
MGMLIMNMEGGDTPSLRAIIAGMAAAGIGAAVVAMYLTLQHTVSEIKNPLANSLPAIALLRYVYVGGTIVIVLLVAVILKCLPSGRPEGSGGRRGQN